MSTLNSLGFQRLNQHQKERKVKWETLQGRNEDVLDEDGYPTLYCLELIENWPYEQPWALFEWLKDKVWTFSDYLSIHKQDSEVQISTAGWSGNESCMNSLQKNTMIWGLYWYSSKRGGHCTFEIDAEDREPFKLF